MSHSHEPVTVDAHAHIAADVTPAQVRALGDAVVFAMTRSIDEARRVVNRRDRNLLWGLGVHPGVPEALDEYSEEVFSRALDHFSLVGEIGLDRRGAIARQSAVLKSILGLCSGRAVLLSIHSTGRVRPTLELLSEQPHPGAILHWFNGNPAEVRDAVELGCHFSVNAAMDPEIIACMPPERILVETDFPSSRRKTKARKPGDVGAAIELVQNVHGLADANAVVVATLSGLADGLGIRDHLSEPLRRAGLG